MKFLFIILILFSCAPTRSFIVDGSKSYAATGSYIVRYDWSGNATFVSPNSITTSGTGKKGRIIYLTVTDNKGLTGDTSYIIP